MRTASGISIHRSEVNAEDGMTVASDKILLAIFYDARYLPIFLRKTLHLLKNFGNQNISSIVFKAIFIISSVFKQALNNHDFIMWL